jgi:hypothetical protein
MRRSHVLTELTVAAFTFANPLMAESAFPPGPPWHSTCNELSEKGFGLAFTSDGCKAEFLAVFQQGNLEGTHAWMKQNRTCFKEWAHFSWLAYERNDPQMAALGWYHQLYILNERLGAGAECENLECHQDQARSIVQAGTSGQIGSAAVAHTTAFLNDVRKNEKFKRQMDRAYANVTPICLYHGNLECRSAMRRLLDLMYPRSYQLQTVPVENLTFSMVDTFERLFTDTQSQRYASAFALKIMDEINNGTFARIDGPKFFEMGLDAFNHDSDRFWDFITVYATRGAAFATAYQMVTDDNKPLFAALMIVSSAMALGDTALIEHGQSWSYIDQTDTTCYQSKPYHYWMSASFAQQLVRDGFSRETSILVSRLLGALYEVGSTTMGRDPDEIYFVPAFAPVVNRARREIAHHLLGSQFGADWRQTTEQDFDDFVLRFMQSSKPLPQLSEAEMRQRLKNDLERWKMWTSLTGFYLN